MTAASVASGVNAANSATSANTASTLVARDASGNFSAGTITANLVGNVTGFSSLNVLKSGDTMTGALNLPTDGLVVGTTQLVTSTGRVGIGTATPAGTLDVQGGTNATGAGESINMTAQNAAPGTTAFGGAINLTAGASSVTTGGKFGGAVNITGGQGAYVSGLTRMGAGGIVTVKGGPGGLGDGGKVTIIGGNGGSTTNAAGGAISLIGGIPQEGTGGSIGISGGNAVTTAGTGNYPGGSVSLSGGGGVGTGVGGNVAITGGPGIGTGAAAGNVLISGGGSNSGAAGNVVIAGGFANSGFTAGNITLAPGMVGGGVGTPGNLLIPNGNIGIGPTTPLAPIHVSYDPSANANIPLFALGTGAFDGTTAGYYVGNSNGTVIGINSGPGYTGDFLNFQINGVSKFKVDGSGNTSSSGNSVSSGNYSTSGNISTTGLGTITSAGVLMAASGVTSTSPTSGSLIVTGGAGISGSLFTGSNITANGNISTASSTAATSGSNQSSPSLYLTANYWNGSASAVDQWSLQNILGTGTNPTSTLQFNHTGSSGSTQYQFMSGNVGIGMTPSQKLSVNGTIHADQAQYSPGLILRTTTGASTVSPNIQLIDGQATPASIYLRKDASSLIMIGVDGATNRLKVAADGTGDSYLNAANFAIGHTAPAVRLDVRGPASGGEVTRLSNSTGESGVSVQQGAATGTTYTNLQAYSGSGASNSTMVINGNGGNVGIGTATPANWATLDVNGTIKGNQVYAVSQDNSTCGTWTARNSWVYPTNGRSVTVPQNGTYVITHSSRAFANATVPNDMWWKVRVYNLTQGTTLVVTFGINKGTLTTNADMTVSGTWVASLSAGDVLRTEYWVQGSDTATYTCANSDGGSSLLITRIAN